MTMKTKQMDRLCRDLVAFGARHKTRLNTEEVMVVLASMALEFADHDNDDKDDQEMTPAVVEWTGTELHIRRRLDKAVSPEIE
jgi:hypothetical protein